MATRENKRYIVQFVQNMPTEEATETVISNPTEMFFVGPVMFMDTYGDVVPFGSGGAGTIGLYKQVTEETKKGNFRTISLKIARYTDTNKAQVDSNNTYNLQGAYYGPANSIGGYTSGYENLEEIILVDKTMAGGLNRYQESWNQPVLPWEVSISNMDSPVLMFGRPQR